MRAHWTAEEDATLRKLAAEGLSSREIGKLMDRPRCSIIGRSRRLPDCQLRGAPCVSNGKQWTPDQDALLHSALPTDVIAERLGRNPDAIRHRAFRIGASRKMVRPPKFARAPVRIEEPPPPSGSKTIIELGSSDCRWPYGDPRSPDFRYCGTKIGDGCRSYCPAHHRKAWMTLSQWRAAMA